MTGSCRKGAGGGRSMSKLKLFSLVACGALAGLTGAAPPAKDAKKDAKSEKPAWDVSHPPGEWKPITIDTDETTWTNLDVSPDGRTIVFDMLGDLYTVPITGGEAKPLTSGIAWDFEPRFSPDGATIAFISDRGGADNLWLMKADGTDPRAVTEEKEHLVHNPSFSHDGRTIVAKKDFTSTRSIPAGEIWLFSVGGGEGLQVTERPLKEKDQKTMAEPAFSVDDRSIYYSQDVTPGRTWEYNKDSTTGIFAIKRLDRATGETETVVSGPGGAIRPTPSPDGKKLAFVKRTPSMTSALYVKDLASGHETALYDKLDRDLQETNGSEGNTPSIAWTPDSESLVFWAGGKIRRVDVASRETKLIPVRVRAKLEVHRALRFPVTVAPDEVAVKMIRWAQYSPDGARVVFQALGHLYVKEVAGGAARRLTSENGHFEFYPSFSSDGRSIVYVTWDDQKLGAVRVVPATGGVGRTLTTDPGHYVEPRFSPDGTQVTYRKLEGGFLVSGDWSMAPGLYVVSSAGGGTPKRLSKTGFQPQFSAAGDRLFYSETDEEDTTTLLLKSVDLEGHDPRTHVKGAKATEFSVSPDGRWLAFTEQFNAYVAPFMPTGKTVEIGAESKGVPVKQVSKRSGEFLHWSADSQKLHWALGATLYTRELKDAFGFLAGAPATLPEAVDKGLDLSFRVPADVPAGRIALEGARIVTMRDAEHVREVIERGVLLVNRNRIEAVGPVGQVTIPPDARRIDVSGKTIVPGLVDVHAHGAMAREELTPEQNWQQYSNLAFGVTTIHDPSNDTSEVFAAAELRRAGAILGPRIFSTGTILYGAHVPAYTAKIESLDDARFHVQRLKDVGAISVKSYQQPRRDQRQQVIAAGRELGMMVVPEGGAKFQHNMTEIVDGHTGIEHAISIARGYKDVEQLWSASETGYTPTLGVAYGGLSGELYWYEHTNVWEDEHLMRLAPHSVIEPASMRRTKAPEQHYNHIEVARFAKQLRGHGVSVQLGAHGQREGLAAHWELWMLEQGGFTPWEALRAGTIDGARYVGLDHDIGSIEVGKLADLVVIDGNPLEDLHRSEYVTYTMQNGRLYDAATMNQIAPQQVAREPFFFELEGGDTIHPTTEAWLERLRERYGWAH